MRVCSSCKALLKADAMRCPMDGASADLVETLPNGTRLGVFRIERVLGEGGMGFVYEATHEVLNRRTAIKMLRPELSNQPQIVTRFLNEAKAVNLINHQNIVNVYDYGDSQDGSVYFVMEFLDGETLDDLMRKRRPMQLPLLLHLFGQISKALAAAHSKQIVHRDLKPANVFVIAREDNPFFVKLLDFGIAQLRGAGAVQGLTVMGTVMGTPQYMSPEQVTGGAVDARSDVWAMGVMLYRAATGEAPYKGEEFADLAGKILHTVPRPAGELVQMPAALSALIMSCLERGVEYRCPSIVELIAGLERAKREAGLDDDSILNAVFADAGAMFESRPGSRSSATSPNAPGSLSWWKQLIGTNQPAPLPTLAAPAPRRSRLGLYLAIGGAAAAALGGAAYAVIKDDHTVPIVIVADAPVADAPPPQPDAPFTQLIAAGDLAGARALADRNLRAAISTGTLQKQGFAVDAIALTRVTAGAPLLYIALKGQADLRVKAARALGDLALPDANSKVLAALAESGDKIKVELAAVSFRLGGPDARAILKRALEDPGMRLTAAQALAQGGDAAGRAVLVEILAATPVGREQWRRAAAALMALGDGSARSLLQAELAQVDATRAVAAAEALAGAGDSKARDVLARNVADPEFTRPGDAALALARLRDARALSWVAKGLASPDRDERRFALAIWAAPIANNDKTYTGTIAKLADDDPDLSVRMTAEAVFLGL
jgi:eukaryotic-like serine/threonine-protein kinase